MGSKSKPSKLANQLFDQGHSVEEVAEEFRKRYDVYREDEQEE